MTLPKKLRDAAVPLALSILLVGAVISTIVRPVSRLNDGARAVDFDSFYYGAEAVKEHGRSYYDEAFMRSLRQKETGIAELPGVTAPPFSTVPYLPLVGMGLVRARQIWHLCDLIFLTIALFLVWTTAGLLLSQPRAPYLGLFFGLMIATFYSPLRFHYFQAQSNILVFLLLALAARGAVLKRNGALVGTALAAAFLTKVFPAAVLPLFLTRDRWRTLGWFAGACLLLVVVTLPLTGASDYLVYPRHLTASYYFGEGVDAIHNLSWKKAGIHAATFLFPEAPLLKSIWSLLVLAPLLYVYSANILEQERLELGSPRDVAFTLRFWQATHLLGVVMASLWEYHLIFVIGGFALITRLWWSERVAQKKSFTLAVVGFLLATSTSTSFMTIPWWGMSVYFWLRFFSIVFSVTAIELAIRRVTRVAKLKRREGARSFLSSDFPRAPGFESSPAP